MASLTALANLASFLTWAPLGTSAFFLLPGVLSGSRGTFIFSYLGEILLRIELVNSFFCKFKSVIVFDINVQLLYMSNVHGLGKSSGCTKNDQVSHFLYVFSSGFYFLFDQISAENLYLICLNPCDLIGRINEHVYI